jgi:hypothetical protein
MTSTVYIAFVINKNDPNKLFMIGIYTDTVFCKIKLREHMEGLNIKENIYKIQKVYINTNFIEQEYYYKMNIDSFINPIIAKTYDELIYFQK